MSARRFSAGVVVVRFAGASPRFLLLRAFRYWDFPKGAVEAGERAIDAARREVREETGIGDLVFRWGEIHRDTPPYRGGKIARYFIAESPADRVYLPVSPELGRPEHHEYRWLAAETARPLLVERVRAILDWAETIVAAP